MKQITLRLPIRTLAELEREARDAGRSRSEHIRDVLESRRDTPEDAPDPERVRELEQQLAARERDLDAAEARQDELRTMLKAANRRNDETQALVRYVEERKKGRLTRAKEWLFGRD